MGKNWFEDLLAAHADQLAAGDERMGGMLAAAPDRQAELAELMTLACRLKEVLVLIQPQDTFRRDLQVSLLAAANQGQLAGLPPPGRRPGPWALGLAAVASGFSVAVGVITVIVLARLRTNQAPTPSS